MKCGVKVSEAVCRITICGIVIVKRKIITGSGVVITGITIFFICICCNSEVCLCEVPFSFVEMFFRIAFREELLFLGWTLNPSGLSFIYIIFGFVELPKNFMD